MSEIQEWYDDDEPPARRKDLGEDAVVRMMLPVGRSGWAIAAGYLGLVSPLMIFAPFALVTGILAVREIRRNPKLHGMGRAVFGVVMGGICSVGLVIWLVVLVAALATKR